MIARLRGTVIDASTHLLTVDVQGVGYQVRVVDEMLFPLGTTVDLSIYYHWTQEHGPSLYGFSDALSKELFGAVISCSGCGPKLGLAILAHFKPSEFIQVVTAGDIKGLSAVSGIGQKKAELIIMHLKDKVVRFIAQAPVEESASLKKLQQVQGALEALHYKKGEVAQALELIRSDKSFQTVSFDELLRKALAYLARRL